MLIRLYIAYKDWNIHQLDLYSKSFLATGSAQHWFHNSWFLCPPSNFFPLMPPNWHKAMGNLWGVTFFISFTWDIFFLAEGGC